MATTTASTGRRIRLECGLELPDGLVYRGWEPGKQYAQSIVVRNVQLKPLKLRYRTPRTPAFEAPTVPRGSAGATTAATSRKAGRAGVSSTITLSAGNSFTIPVVFRPATGGRPFEDSIEFTTPSAARPRNSGAAHSKGTPAGEDRVVGAVALRAPVPEPDMSLPERLEFGLVAPGATATRAVTLTNRSGLPTTWHLVVPPGFTADPPFGSVGPHGTATVRVALTPAGPATYALPATLKYDAGQLRTATMALTATCKLPFVVVRAPQSVSGQLSFGDQTRPTQVATEYVDLHNVSRVPASCALAIGDEPPGQQGDGDASGAAAFRVAAADIELKPNERRRVGVEFRPPQPGRAYASTLQVRVAHGNMARVACSGACAAPKVHSTPEGALVFPWTAAGSVATQDVILHNTSTIAANFKLSMPDATPFRFDDAQATGQIPPGETVAVPVTFAPPCTGHFAERLLCEIEHHAPIMLSCLGTAGTPADTSAPTPLPASAVQLTRSLEPLGVASCPPSELARLVQQGALVLDNDGGLVSLERETTIGGAPEADKGGARRATAVPSVTAESRAGEEPPAPTLAPLQCEPQLVAFGACAYGSKRKVAAIAPATVTATNNTGAPIHCSWLLDDPSGDFRLDTPSPAVVPPHETLTATLRFVPRVGNTDYVVRLKCVAAFAELVSPPAGSDPRLVPLPWTWTALITGTTAADAGASAEEQGALTASDAALHYPPAVVGAPAARVLWLRNDGAHPVPFALAPELEPELSVECAPSQGLVAPGAAVAVVVTLRAGQAGPVRATLGWSAGGVAQPAIALEGCGCVVEPTVSTDTLRFAPTAVGEVRLLDTLQILNPAPVDVLARCSWEGALGPFRLPDGDNQADGALALTIPALGRCTVPVAFQPSGSGLGEATLRINILGSPRHAEASSEPVQAFSVRCAGEAGVGQLTVPDPDIDLGACVLGDSLAHTLQLVNPSSFPVRFHLHSTDPALVELGSDQGVLPANTRAAVPVVMRPLEEGVATGALTVTLGGPSGSDDTALTTVALCRLTAHALAPRLVVSDVRGAGRQKGLLWDMFRVAELNEALASPGAARPALELNFGGAPAGAADTAVFVELTNSGLCAAEWQVLFPDDVAYKPERWSQNEHPSAQERDRMRILDARLFACAPKRGRLEPGASCVVRLSHANRAPSVDRLPITLRVGTDEPVHLQLCAACTPPGSGQLQLASATHRFDPVAVGELHPPTQHLPLYNDGDAPLAVDLDLTSVELLNQAHGHPVLQCGLSSLTVPARGQALVPWRFQPLEARTLEAVVTLDTAAGPTLVTLSAAGFLPGQPPAAGTPSPHEARRRIPDRQTAALPGQAVFLSQERLDLGRIPLQGVVRRVVFLENRGTAEHAFAWDVSALIKCLDVQPRDGVLAAGQALACTLTFTACDGLHIHASAAVCRVQPRRKKPAGAGATTSSAAPGPARAARSRPRQRQERPGSGGPRLSTLRDGKSGGKQNGEDLRAPRHQVLPPIGADPGTAGEPARKGLELSLEVLAEVCHPSAVSGDAWPPASDFVATEMGAAEPRTGPLDWSPQSTQSSVVVGVLDLLLSDVLADPGLHEAMGADALDPRPVLYRQLVPAAGTAKPAAAGQGLEASGGFLAVLEGVLGGALAELLSEAEDGGLELTDRAPLSRLGSAPPPV